MDKAACDRQADRILSERLVEPEVVDRALRQAYAEGVDLCSVLSSWGKLDDDTADSIRSGSNAAHKRDVRIDEDATVSMSDTATSVDVPAAMRQATSDSDPDATLDEAPQEGATMATGTYDASATTGAGDKAGAGATPEHATVHIPGALDRFEILGEISRGGMGIVYVARHRRLNHKVALKVMRRGGSDRELKRFELEAQALAHLKHENIVRIIDYGDDDGVPFIAMDFVDGVDLKRHVDDTVARTGAPPEVAWTLRLMKPVADALTKCHSHQVIHRDLKPHNILVEAETDRPVLVDFGLVKAEQGDAASLEDSSADGSPGAAERRRFAQDVQLTQPGALLGTPAYMAPEQISPDESDAEPGKHTDVWGFGATLYYALTGRLPFQANSIVGLRTLMNERPPKPACELNTLVSRRLSNLCQRCMSIDPNERPEIHDVAALLELELAGRRLSTRQLIARAALMSLLLCGIAALSTWLALKAPPPELKSLDAVPAWINTKEAHLAGVAAARSRVVIERIDSDQSVTLKTIDVGADGRFGWTVDLADGPHRLRVSADGSPETAHEVDVFVDRTLPKVTLENAIAHVVDIDAAAPRIVGTIDDDGPCTITCSLSSDRAETTADAHTFTLPLPTIDAPTPMTLEVRDAAGNVRTMPLVVFRHMEALLDRERWQAATTADQDAAMAEMSVWLGDAFEFLGAQDYTCGGQSHRIGVYRHVKSGIPMHLVPGGTFTLGNVDVDRTMNTYLQAAKQVLEMCQKLGISEHPTKLTASTQRDAFKTELPTHEVRVPPFLVAQTELLQGEWTKVAGKPRAVEQRTPNHPQAWVTHDEAEAWLREAGDGLRLPSEAEWEYACRAGTRSVYFWGDEPDFSGRYDVWWITAINVEVARHNREHPGEPLNLSLAQLRPLPIDVAPRDPNAFGLIDTLGNLWEMCADVYNYSPYPAGPMTYRPVLNLKSEYSARRGGGFLYGGPTDSRCSIRGQTKRDESRWALGFRVFRSVVPDEPPAATTTTASR
ncbi:MAG: SUMF1/EgtB/PvdO family nonheme iron enzyme [Phycisphaera sp.]|nr:SUMF1/EgtB/PvdO family nonheme iron enzyme [Phycisphaera sp.]